MPQIIREVSVAAGATNDNLVAGSAFEYCKQALALSMGVGQAATGCFHTVNVGNTVVAEEFSPPILTRFPIIPDEFYITEIGQANDRIVIKARNPTGGAVVQRAIVLIGAAR